jgi:hypothetical protein
MDSHEFFGQGFGKGLDRSRAHHGNPALLLLAAGQENLGKAESQGKNPQSRSGGHPLIRIFP